MRFLNHPEPKSRVIRTTRRTGSRGYNRASLQLGDASGNYTNNFGGTSGACPGTVGVTALALSVDPDLQWQKMRDVTRRALDKFDPQGRRQKYSVG